MPGEGTRGGHVIGHTRSGKPIYGLPHDAVSFPNPKGHVGKRSTENEYTVQDHLDAAKTHLEEYSKAEPFSKHGKWNRAVAKLHIRMFSPSEKFPAAPRRDNRTEYPNIRWEN